MKSPSIPESRAKKLFPRDWLEIVNLAKTGVKVPVIAKKYDTDASVIYRGLKHAGLISLFSPWKRK